MLDRLWASVTDWPVILQSVVGSALFWALAHALTALRRPVIASVTRVSARAALESKIREYVYLRYATRDGLANYTQGYFLLFNYALRSLLRGLLFVCFALAIGGLHPAVLGIVLGGAAFHFLRALTWVTTPRNVPDDVWPRVAELEQELFGRVEPRTAEILDRRTTAETPRATRGENRNKPEEGGLDTLLSAEGKSEAADLF